MLFTSNKKTNKIPNSANKSPVTLHKTTKSQGYIFNNNSNINNNTNNDINILNESKKYLKSSSQSIHKKPFDNTIRNNSNSIRKNVFNNT